MILSDRDILRCIDSGEIVVSPFKKENVRPASLDVTLSNHFKQIKKGKRIVMGERVEYEEFIAETILLPPHSFIFASTVEYIKIPDTLAFTVQGHSSIGRIGLFVQNTEHGEPGFNDQVTLKLLNCTNNPMLLKAGVHIGQLIFSTLSSPCRNPYAGKYNGQCGATESRLYEDPVTI